MARVFLVHWNEAEADERREQLHAWGHEVVGTETEDGDRAVRAILDEPPQVVVIHLDRLPSHGRETAHALRQTKPGQLIPLVFVGGEADKVRKVRDVVSQAVYTSAEDLEGVLGDL